MIWKIVNTSQVFVHGCFGKWKWIEAHYWNDYPLILLRTKDRDKPPQSVCTPHSFIHLFIHLFIYAAKYIVESPTSIWFPVLGFEKSWWETNSFAIHYSVTMQCDKCYDGFKYKVLLTHTRQKFNPVLRGQYESVLFYYFLIKAF